MANNNIFVLDDGTKEYIIENTFHEEICRLHIPSGDIGIIDRYKTFMKDFDDIIAPLHDIDIKNDGTVDDENGFVEEHWKVLKSVEKNLIDKINKVFDMKDGDKLFANRNAFSTVGGVFYAEKVIEMLGKIVGEAISDESKKSQVRISKYTKDLKG